MASFLELTKPKPGSLMDQTYSLIQNGGKPPSMPNVGAPMPRPQQIQEDPAQVWSALKEQNQGVQQTLDPWASAIQPAVSNFEQWTEETRPKTNPIESDRSAMAAKATMEAVDPVEEEPEQPKKLPTKDEFMGAANDKFKTGRFAQQPAKPKEEKMAPRSADFEEIGTGKSNTLIPGGWGLGDTSLSFDDDRVRNGTVHNEMPLFASEDDPNLGTYSNPVSKILEDVLALNTTVAQNRANWADDNSNWKVKIGGADYSEDDWKKAEPNFEQVLGPEGATHAADGYVLPDGTTIPLEIWNARQFDEANQAVNFPGMGAIPADQYSGATVNLLPIDQASPDADAFYSASYTMPDGQVVGTQDLILQEQGGKAERYQDNAGLANIGKVDPKAPWEDIGDTLPWMLDVAAGSLPYFIPGYNLASAASRILPAAQGYDPDTFNPKDRTYENKEFNNGQWLGAMASPATDYLVEKLPLGVMVGGKTSKMMKGAKTIPGQVARGSFIEGVEEMPSAAFEQLQADGWLDYGKDVSYDPQTGEPIYDDETTGEQRIANTMTNLRDGLLSGAVFGAPISLGASLADRNKNKKAFGNRGTAKAEATQIMPTSQYDDLGTLAQKQRDADAAYEEAGR